MIKSFEVTPQNSSATNANTTSSTTNLMPDVRVVSKQSQRTTGLLFLITRVEIGPMMSLLLSSSNGRASLVVASIAILMLGVIPSVYAHTENYMKGFKLGREDGKTGGGGYGKYE
jgi:hypothetical protein